MARIVTAGLLIGLVLGSLGHAAEEPETEARPEFTPGIDLVRLGTVGDLPPPDSRLVVDVDAEGRILVAGKPLAYAELKDLVARRADVSREDAGPAASHLDLVLRIDRSVPWCVAQWLVVLGADPYVRVWKYHFAVRPVRGDAEGTLALAAHKDRGLMPTPDPGRKPPARLPIRIRGTGDGSEPGRLDEPVRAAVRMFESTYAHIDADPLVPTGYVLRVIDRVVSSGVEELSLVYTAAGRATGESFVEAVRAARKAGATPTIEVSGRIVDRGAVPTDDVARIRPGFAARMTLRVRNLPDMDEAPTVPAPPFRNRLWRRSLKAYGGEGTQTTVAHGLDWLAHHQHRDGRWGAADFEVQCRLNRCGGKGNAAHDTGVTGLAVLAFLGIDQTGRRGGRYEDTVRRGLEKLRAVQQTTPGAEGCFGPLKPGRFTYDHAIATLAMAEAYALTGSPACRESAQSGVDFIERCRNPGLAWRYGVRPGDDDTSVTTWMVAALSVARAAGLKVPDSAFEGARAWLAKVTEKDGRVRYTMKGAGAPRPAAFPPARTRSLTAAGIWMRLLLGEHPDRSPAIRKGVERCLEVLPEWDGGSVDPYYWHLGSLALFQVGGKPWERWNRSLRAALIDHQRKQGDQRGSWDPVGPWGAEGGRVYSTAISVLTLETYYRYARMHGDTR